MPLTYTDNKYEEIVDGWRIYVWKANKPIVDGEFITTRRMYQQEFTVNDDGSITFDVMPDEKADGWGGDCAQSRTVPGSVIRAALRIWDAARE
jgi:hypothetical protein